MIEGTKFHSMHSIPQCGAEVNVSLEFRGKFGALDRCVICGLTVFARALLICWGRFHSMKIIPDGQGNVRWRN